MVSFISEGKEEKVRKTFIAAVCALGLLAGLAVQAQEMDPLLKILVENHVITEEQALAVQAQYNHQKEQQKEQQKTEVKQTVDESLKTSTVAPKLPSALEGLKIGGLGYISFQNGNKYAGTANETTSYNDFVLKRGYLDVQKTITPFMDARITTDITRDAYGDWKPRIKYLYAKFHWDDKGTGFVSQPYVEFGQAHVPWHDFEEAINGFRMQDPMFIERNGIFNSADMGVMIGGNFGGQMSSDYKKNVDGHYAGRYGTFQLGIYQGGGYHAADKNQNKVFEGRVTVRPFPGTIPGLQFTAFGVNGKGNVASVPGKELPDWKGWDGMISYESHYFTATAQYLDFKGNQSGTALNADGSVRKQKGYSFFVRGSFPPSDKWGLIGRYDRFDPNPEAGYAVADDVQKTLIGGVYYNIFKSNKLLLDYQVKQHNDPQIPDEKRVQLTMQVAF